MPRPQVLCQHAKRNFIELLEMLGRRPCRPETAMHHKDKETLSPPGPAEECLTARLRPHAATHSTPAKNFARLAMSLWNQAPAMR
jgi:hypothetical protein